MTEVEGNTALQVKSRDGTVLDVEVKGREDAPPVVLLHGVSSSRTTYDWLPDSVGEGRRMIRADFRGHGGSQWTPGRYDLQRYFEDTVAILEQAASRPAVLVGFSLGGCTAWMVAQQRPELVTAILMEDPPLYGGEAEVHEAAGIGPILQRSIEQEMEWTRRGASEEEATDELAATPMGPHRVFADVMHRDSIRSLATSTLRRDRGVTESAISRQMLDGLDTRSPLHRPSLLLAGGDANGGVFTTAHEARLAETHPEVPVVRVSSCGHGLQTWKAGREAYLTVLLGFLQRHAPAQHV